MFKTLTSNVTISGCRTLKEVIKVKSGPIGVMFLKEEEEVPLHRKERPCEDTLSKWPPASHGKKPQETKACRHLSIGMSVPRT